MLEMIPIGPPIGKEHENKPELSASTFSFETAPFSQLPLQTTAQFLTLPNDLKLHSTSHTHSSLTGGIH